MRRPGQNSAASATMTEFYSKNSPFDLLKKQTVDASVESIVQQSPKTYEVTWTEVTRDLVGQFVASHRYQGIRVGDDTRSHGCEAGVGKPARALCHEPDMGRGCKHERS